MIRTVNDRYWNIKYNIAILKHNLTTAQKLIIVRFLINLENITDI